LDGRGITSQLSAPRRGSPFNIAALAHSLSAGDPTIVNFSPDGLIEESETDVAVTAEDRSREVGFNDARGNWSSQVTEPGPSSTERRTLTYFDPI
jgi:hypothetical protein